MGQFVGFLRWAQWAGSRWEREKHIGWPFWALNGLWALTFATSAQTKPSNWAAQPSLEGFDWALGCGRWWSSGKRLMVAGWDWRKAISGDGGWQCIRWQGDITEPGQCVWLYNRQREIERGCSGISLKPKDIFHFQKTAFIFIL